MDLKELNYIVTIANEGSISGAAEKLYMAQSSLSQALQLLESELGTPIFVRTSRGVRPTASGEVYIAHIRQILNHYHLAQSEVWDMEELGGGRIELGISTFRGTYLLPPVLKRFHELYPHVHVEITEMDSINLENLILEGLLDIAVIATPPIRLKHNIDFLMKDELLLIATEQHPIMKYAHPCENKTEQLWIDLKDTAPFEYILGPPNTVMGRILRKELRRCKVEPLGLNTNVSAPFAAAMARNGLGLALTYRSCIVPHKNACYLRIGPEGIFLNLALACPIVEYRSKATLALQKLFHEIYK